MYKPFFHVRYNGLFVGLVHAQHGFAMTNLKMILVFYANVRITNSAIAPIQQVGKQRIHATFADKAFFQ